MNIIEKLSKLPGDFHKNYGILPNYFFMSDQSYLAAIEHAESLGFDKNTETKEKCMGLKIIRWKESYDAVGIMFTNKGEG